MRIRRLVLDVSLGEPAARVPKGGLAAQLRDAGMGFSHDPGTARRRRLLAARPGAVSLELGRSFRRSGRGSMPAEMTHPVTNSLIGWICEQSRKPCFGRTLA